MIMMGYPKFLEVQYTYVYYCMYKYIESLVLSLASFQASSHIIPTKTTHDLTTELQLTHPKPRGLFGFSELKIRAVFKRRYFVAPIFREKKLVDFNAFLGDTVLFPSIFFQKEKRSATSIGVKLVHLTSSTSGSLKEIHSIDVSNG